MDFAYRQMRNEALLMLQYEKLRKQISQPIEVVETSAVTCDGLEKIFDWLSIQWNKWYKYVSWNFKNSLSLDDRKPRLLFTYLNFGGWNQKCCNWLVVRSLTSVRNFILYKNTLRFMNKVTLFILFMISLIEFIQLRLHYLSIKIRISHKN